MIVDKLLRKFVKTKKLKTYAAADGGALLLDVVGASTGDTAQDVGLVIASTTRGRTFGHFCRLTERSFELMVYESQYCESRKIKNTVCYKNSFRHFALF